MLDTWKVNLLFVVCSLLCTSVIHLAPMHIATLVLFDVGWVLYFISLCQSLRWSVQGF